MAKAKRKYRTLKPTLPNAGVEAAYRKQLFQIVRELMRDFPGELNQDYVFVLRQFTEHLRNADVTEKFYREAERIARTFVNRASNHTQSALRVALESAGYNPRQLESLRRVPGALENVKNAIYRENVALIRRMPEETARQIERMVNDSVVRGSDLGGMVKELMDIPDMTLRRAQIIARDQNNKATQSMALVRMQSLGITHGVWMHRSGGKTFRPTHVTMDGEKFPLAEGLYDMNEGRNVFPAELINCHCTFESILPDLE